MLEPDVGWPRTKREGHYYNKYLVLSHKVERVPWYGIGVGFSIASLFWGVMFSVFIG